MSRSKFEKNNLVQPEMSVILVVPDCYDTIRPTVFALAGQTVKEKLEIIVVGLSGSRLNIISSDLKGFANYQVLEVNSKVLAHAQAAAVRRAKAPVVALTEDHCFPDKHWAEALINRHREPWAAVGPVLYNANPHSAVSWANFIMKYGDWIPPLPGHPPRHLPSHNSSYKRAVLLEFGDHLENALESESPMQWQMVKRGYALYLEAGAKSYHLNYSHFWNSILVRLHGGRLFAARRARKWPLLKKVFYFFGSPFIPLVRLVRTLRIAHRIKKDSLIPRMLPFLVILLAVDGLGEMIGYLFGSGRAAEKISEREFHRERFLTRHDRKLVERMNKALFAQNTDFIDFNNQGYERKKLPILKRFFRIANVFLTRRLVFEFDKIEFTHTNLSGKRILNWVLAELAYLVRSKRVWAYPTHLQLEPVSGCNLSCPLCYVTTHNIPSGALKFEDFRRVIDEIGEYLLFLHFWGWGEPFLNKDMCAMIQYAKSKGIKVITSTNGHFLQDEQNVERLLDSGLDALIIALDGIEQKSYEVYRKCGDFQRVVNSIELIVNKKRQRKASSPKINLRMVVTRKNEKDIPEMERLAEKLGADFLSLKTLGCHGNDELWENLIPENHNLRRFRHDHKGLPIRKKNLCKKMWNHPTVYLNGAVSPCDYYFREESPFGSIFAKNAESFKHIWFGKQYRHWRSRFLSSDLEGLRCHQCCLNYTDTDCFVSHLFPIEKQS